MSDVPPPPDTPQPPNPALVIANALNPYANVNIDEARKLRDQYGDELKETRGALSRAQATRESTQQRNLRAIDESIEGLKNSRYTGAIGLNPAVTAAMAAGFLKTTPGVTSNYANELGNAMGNAAPVISGMEKSGRDSFALLADLQRKRGEFESEPLKEEQAQLREREKTEMANLKEAEKALTRAPSASSATGQQKVDNEREKIKNDLLNKTEAEIKSYTEDKTDAEGNPFSPEQKEAIRKYVRHQRIIENNYGKKPGDPYYIDPGVSGMEPGDEETAKHLMRVGRPLLKGTDKMYRDYQLSEEANGRVPDPREIWESKNKGRSGFEQERAKDDAERLDKAPGIVRVGQQTNETVDRVLNHPGLDKVVGISPTTIFAPNMSAEARGFVTVMKNFKSELFLQGIAQMKGMGQLSDAEGKRLESAIAAVDTAQTPEDFRRELRRVKEGIAKLEAAVQQDVANIKRRRGIDQPKPPAIGEIRDGHRFKGGNPGDLKNWEPI